MKLSTKQLALIAVLASLTLVLGFLETLIPLPVTVPGLKLGLANVTVLFAMYALDTKSAAFLMLVKVLVSNMLFGSPMMIAYSAAGSVLAFAGMWALKQSNLVGVPVVSAAAAILHNVGQLITANVLLHTALVWVNAPFLIIGAVITGLATGALALAVLHALEPTLRLEKAAVSEPDACE